MSQHDISGRSQWRFGAIFLLLAAVLACLSVLLINRGPLYYFDTGSYFKQGDAALSLFLPDTSAEEVGVGAGQGGQSARNETTSGSRSMAYAVLVAAFWRADALGGIALVQLAAVLLSAWLVVRVVRRIEPIGRSTTQLVTIPLLAAVTTSLPFYVAYVMPDIFASVMLIQIAAVAAMGSEMRLAEYVVSLALAVFAVLVHPSHLGIAVLLLPVVLLAAVLRIGGVRWLAVGFAICLVLVAVLERKAFEFAAENVARKEVVYTPHITARLIVDGPGLAYLDENCPRTDLATCALHEALSWSDDPYRLTAAHIIFERSQRLGSFRLMSDEDQKAVAGEQREFFFRVLAARPIGTALALAGNAFEQSMMTSVRMTIPNTAVINNAKALSGLPEERLRVLDRGILTREQPWLGLANATHSIIYAVSFVIVIGLLLWSNRVARPLKVFAIFLLIGIAINALVCGGVSRPADRYGARVMWLLPFVASLLLLSRPRPKTRSETGGPA